MGIRTTFNPMGAERIDYVSWIQSDGSAYIDTGFVIPNFYTRFDVTASCLQSSGGHNKSPLFASGLATGVDSAATYASTSVGGFMFSSIYTDRQVAMNIGRTRIWNANAYSGNWRSSAASPVFYTFTDCGIQTATATSIPDYSYDDSVCKATQNGTVIHLASEGGTATFFRTYPLSGDTVAVFASHQGDSFCMCNSDYQLKYLAFKDTNGVILAEFRPAARGGRIGLYNTVNKTFHAAAGGTMKYGRS